MWEKFKLFTFFIILILLTVNGIFHCFSAATAEQQRYQQKCREYQSAIFPLAESSSEKCNFNKTERNDDDSDVKMTEFPHLALIGYDDKEEDIIYYCLGALVSDRFVLTAARCLRYGPGPPKVIRVGGINSNDKNMEDIKAEKFFIHPDYGTKSNDIGLIKLEKSITIDQFKRPACLPSAPDWLQSFAFETNIYRLEKKLFIQKSKLEKYSEEECKRFYPEEYIHTNISYERQICAGTKRSERDLIRQSSRGPLQIYHPNEFCMYEIVGINSFGECCATLTPDVFTRIHSYNDWIESIVWK